MIKKNAYLSEIFPEYEINVLDRLNWTYSAGDGDRGKVEMVMSIFRSVLFTRFANLLMEAGGIAVNAGPI